ncbi:MAG: hypothetical protein N2050_02470 [Flavobacteriales bacterium]|nr:hypothetical protein [Flavobacteriales bacterium]
MKVIYVSLLLCIHLLVRSQGVSLNTTGNPPDNSAILDVSASDKGLLIPRVALSSPSSPIPAPATGLLVFNTSTSGSYPIPGFFYFNGTDWVCMSCAGSASSSKIFYRRLTSSVTNTVSTSSAGNTTLFNFNYTPVNDTILIQVNAAARISSSSSPPAALQKWGFRVLVNSVLQKIVYAFPNANIVNSDLFVSFTIPVAVTPSTSHNITIQLGGLLTSSGSLTLRIDPANTTEFANVIIHDVPTNE